MAKWKILVMNAWISSGGLLVIGRMPNLGHPNGRGTEINKIQMKTRLFFSWAISLLLLINIAPIAAQPSRSMVQVLVSPDHANWEYKTGEKVTFTVVAMRNGSPMSDLEVRYKFGPELLEPKDLKTAKLQKGKLEIEAGTMKTHGFLRCWAYLTIDGKEYSGYATAGFEPANIQPIVKTPADFDQFWAEAKSELAQLPLDARMTLMPEKCTEKVDVYHVNFQNYPARARVYGILCMPKAPGKYPAVLRVPGAGIRPYGGDIGTAEKGVITLQIGIHGIPVNMDQEVYNNLAQGALNGYQVFNLKNKHQYYFKRVYLGCVRSVDFLYSLPNFDGERLAVAGGSQGGALSIVTAGLDKRVKWIVPYYPALCDMVGYTANRAGGWPHMFHPDNKNYQLPAEMETSAYYDVVNFAKKVKAEGYYSWGFNDNVCPPTSMYAAYNVITAPKKLYLALETGHWTYPEQHVITDAWLWEKLGVK